jgi:predicted TIM-barrel fold metal-dependent hydrolase
VLVDAHTHLLPDRLGAKIRRVLEAYMGPSLAYPYPVAEARAAIVAAGVERCWSLPYAHKPGMASALNRWMAEAFRDDPVVVPGATLHPADDVVAVLDEALGELGLPLLKLHCSVGDFEPDDGRLDPLWRRVSDGGQPVVIHAGHAVNGLTSAGEVECVGRVARRWPDARIILAHCGLPAVDTALALLRTTRTLYADLTGVGPYVTAISSETIAGLEGRLLFGSDAPSAWIRIEDATAHVRALWLEPAAEHAILGENALRLLRR